MEVICGKNNYDVETVIELYNGMIFRLAMIRMGNIEDAQDVTQDTFMRMIMYIKKGGSFHDEEHLKAWLLKVAVNRGKSVLSLVWNKRTEGLERAEKLSASDKSEDYAYEYVLRLQEKYRVAINLFYYEQLSTEQIADIMGQKPALEFTADLKIMAKEMEHDESSVKGKALRQTSLKNRKYIGNRLCHAAAAAAIVILIASLGMMKWWKSEAMSGKDSTDSFHTAQNSMEIKAGKEEDHGIYVGTIGEKSELEIALEVLETESFHDAITDEEGNTVSLEKRKEITDFLRHAGQVTDKSRMQAIGESTAYELYYIRPKKEGGKSDESITDDRIVLKVYESGYVMINDVLLYR